MSKELTIVMYHYVRDASYSPYPGIKSRSIREFENQLQYFNKYFNYVTIDQVINTIHGNCELPTNPVLLTFDDGYIDHFENVYPLLRKYGISGCFYPCGRAVEEKIVLDVNKIHFILASVGNISKLLYDIFTLLDKYREEHRLSGNEYYYSKLSIPNEYDTGDVVFVKRLLQRELEITLRKRIIDILFKKYVTTDEEGFSEELYMDQKHLGELVDNEMHIGVHGYDHHWFDTLDTVTQKSEIDRSLDFIKDINSNQVRSICYPYGAYDKNLLNIINERRFQIGFIVGSRKANLVLENPFLLTRIDTNSFPI
jgi:peptidoglycan/xylan/chitin deacetylase (PgdA/CDA1 family)